MSIVAAGVPELRVQDDDGSYRIFYYITRRLQGELSRLSLPENLAKVMALSAATAKEWQVSTLY